MVKDKVKEEGGENVGEASALVKEPTMEEFQQLKEMVAQQAQAMLLMTEQLNRVAQVSPPSISTPRVMVKPRDVPILTLAQLEGLEAAGTLGIFFDLIEQVSDQDEERVRIAKTRVSPELTLLIQNQQRQGKVNTWEQVKECLQAGFAQDLNFDRAWQEIDNQNFEWAENPQSFVNNLICKYAVQETKFLNEKIPNRDQFIKRKLWKGLTRDARERIEGFLEETYPLSKFLERLEHERQFLLDRDIPGIRKVTEQKPVATLSPPPVQASPPQQVTDMDFLRQQMKSLTEKVEQLSTRSPPAPYCTFCRSNTHSLSNCVRRPPPGACFDCWRPSCRRGNPGCPGRRVRLQ